MYERGSEFIGHEFKNSLIQEEYGIKAKLNTLGNPTYNIILERLHSVLGNLVRTYNLQGNYLDKDDPWMVILSVTVFEIRSTVHTLKGYTSGQLIFGRYMVLPIKHISNWKLIPHRKQAQINYYNAHLNENVLYHNYQVGDRVMLINNS